MTTAYRNRMTSMSKPRTIRNSRSTKSATLQQCLILSADPARQSMFVQAAVDGGWQTLTCSDPEAALTCVARDMIQMAIVDLEGQELADFEPVLARLQRTSGVLLVVCGNEGEVEEEIFVRQLGAWLYLPGVEQGSDLPILCGQARRLSERQATPARRPVQPVLAFRRSG